MHRNKGLRDVSDKYLRHQEVLSLNS